MYARSQPHVALQRPLVIVRRIKTGHFSPVGRKMTSKRSKVPLVTSYSHKCVSCIWINTHLVNIILRGDIARRLGEYFLKALLW